MVPDETASAGRSLRHDATGAQPPAGGSAVASAEGRDAAFEVEREWRAHVRPEKWRMPVPHATYDLVVLGGGTAGLVCAMGAAGLGARVALVERHLLGGDCLNAGCVPSKALIRSARAAGEARKGHSVGVAAAPVVDFPLVMARLRARRAALAPNDSASRLAAAGVHVFFGDGAFVDGRTVQVAGARLRFNRAVIATGTRPAVPPIPGLDRVPFVTNESVFDLETLPQHLIVLGAGPIGCELAQAFVRLGSRVTLFDRSNRVLPNDDAPAAGAVEDCLRRDGIRLELGAQIEGVELDGDRLRVRWRAQEQGARGDATTGDVLLVATGRRVDVDLLNPDAAGVRTDDRGVVVNDRLQSTNRRIFASGDVCSRYKFTHAADAMSRLVVRNALFFGRARASALIVPWVTYTDPEVAHVGVSESDVAASQGRLGAITVPLTTVDRAVVDDETDGYITAYHERGALRGMTIVAPHAGEMIGEAVHALARGSTLGSLSDTIHPYPTYAEALRKAGDQYRRQALTPFVRRLLARYFDWTR